jgi:hypothetical protein
MGKLELTVVRVLHIPLFRTIFGSPRDIQSSLPTAQPVLSFRKMDPARDLMEDGRGYMSLMIT